MSDCDNCKKLEKQNETLKREKEELEKRVEKLEKFLHVYENAHTPSSRLIFKPAKQNNNSNKPRGRPEGYEGTTRAYKKPDKILEKKRKRCDCKRKLKFLYSESMIVEEIPKPQPVIVTEFIINHYECEKHGEIIVKYENCPKSGRFGNNLLAQSAIMRFEERLPLRKIHDSLERLYEVKITPASIMDMTNRVSNALTLEYQEIIEGIKKSEQVYADETSLIVNGKKFWIWTFVTDDAVLFVIRNSRGKKVVNEILGDYQGVVVRDGYAAYNKIGAASQRCWAHILREGDEISDHCKEAEDFCNDLHELFDDTKTKRVVNKNKELLRERSEKRLSEVLEKPYRCMKVMKIVQTIRNGFGDWFTFVTHDVDPTNNRAERSLRELVVIRKIIGCLRSLKSAKTYETVMSCLATWKLNGLNVMDKLLNCLRS